MSNTLVDIAEFFEADSFILFGESPRRKTFAAAIRKELEKNGRRVFAATRSFDGEIDTESVSYDTCDRAIIAMARKNTKSIVDKLKNSGITRVFLQNGSYDDEILAAFRDAGIAVSKGCVLMYLPESGGIHRFHRWLHSLFAR